MDMSLSKLQETVKDREACCAAVHRVTKSQTWQQLNNNKVLFYIERGEFQMVGLLRVWVPWVFFQLVSKTSLKPWVITFVDGTVLIFHFHSVRRVIWLGDNSHLMDMGVSFFTLDSKFRVQIELYEAYNILLIWPSKPQGYLSQFEIWSIAIH